MPITPFHFGPGVALHALAPRHLSFLAFCASNALIDVESVVNLLAARHPVHAFLHTYVGATLVWIGLGLLFWVLIQPAIARRLPDLLGWKRLGMGPVLIGAATGAYSHVLLDSVMHADARPLEPFAGGNPLLGSLTVSDLHMACIGLGLLGLLGVCVRGWLRERRSARAPDRRTR